MAWNLTGNIAGPAGPAGGSGGYAIPSGAWWNTVTSPVVAQGEPVNRMMLAPFKNLFAFTAQAMQLEITTAGTGSSVIRLGIYGTDSTTGLPDFGNLIADLGTKPALAVGQITWSGLSLALPAGRLWVAFAGQGSSTAALRRFSNPSVENFALPVGITPNTSLAQVTMWASVSGAFPTTAPTLNVDGQLQPALSIQAA